jgi:glucosamine--fructose-6-phosphate aminotransferase (isomerizing)
MPSSRYSPPIVAVHVDHPDEIVAVCKSSPLVVGCAAGCAIVASDTPALIEVTRDVVFPDDGVVCLLHASGIVDYCDSDGESVSPETVHVDWSLDEAKLGGYEDFMAKEIAEQPRVVRDTLAGRVKDGKVIIDELALTAEDIAAIDRVYIIACGTSYHAGLIGKNLIEAWSRIPCDVEVASEFRYRDPIVSPSTLVIAVSQSGETADTVEAVQLARTHGARVFAITNSVGSRITRESDGVIYAQAGPEVCVAATKSFLAQVVALTLVALYLGQARGCLTRAQVRMFYREMKLLPDQIKMILDEAEPIERAARVIDGATSTLFIGRGIGATTCCEGALKLKEISYVHAEAFAAGEIKHGPIALVDEATPVVALMIKSATRDKMVSNIAEVRARGAKVIGIATQGDLDAEHICDEVVYIPAVRECFSAITASVVLQMLARSVAKTRGCDVDKPRNLAKSVTVE